MESVGKNIDKVDSLSLSTGRAKFTDDFPLTNPLHCKILYSPHPHAEIIDIDTSRAEIINGVVDILHYKNTPSKLHTTAGQGYPEPSPYDTVLFDNKVRFTGDRVALVAAEDEDTAIQAVNEIDVQYRIIETIFDPEHSMDKNSCKLHDSKRHVVIPTEYDPELNMAAAVDISIGDVEKGFTESDFITEQTYSSHFASHCAIELHSVKVYFDSSGRYVVLTSTQVPFHVRRIISKVLDIPIKSIRVIKPRIGGGFGGKQEVFLEPLAVLVAKRNKRSVRLVLTRKEVFISSRTRHPMRIRIKTGVKKESFINSLEINALMNTGAYGSHALTVLSNTGSKVLPLFNKIDNIKFTGRSVYTNLPIGGAYRGYGATQGYFAFCQHLDILSRKMNDDILKIFKSFHIKEGETSQVFEALGEGKEGVSQYIKSCKLSKCIDLGAREIQWYEKRNKKIKVGKTKVKGVGVSISMQGSGIPKVDMGSASMKMNEDGSFNLFVGATDLGTGSDTILSQIAAEVLDISTDNIIILSSDTDLTPFDVGAYASSTTYISGNAVKKCALKIKEQILKVGKEMLSGVLCSVENGRVIAQEGKKSVSFEEIAYYTLYSANQFQIQASASHFALESPPPFIAQFAEVDVDIHTGKIHLVKFVSAVDCGKAINPNLAEGQIEGAVVNGLSYALCEKYIFDENGKMKNPSFKNYKIFSTLDIPEIKTIIVDSEEETGPFGAKSIGEIAINGPMPSIANAVYDAVGVRIFNSPITAEKIFNKMKEKK